MSTFREAPAEELWSLIKDLRYPVVTTRRRDGRLKSRPMTMQNRSAESLSFLWFFTPGDSEQVDDLQWDSSVSIVFSDPRRAAYVAVFGSAAVIDDLARKEALWSTAATAWFPEGPEDPRLALIRVRIIRADFCDVQRNTVVPLFKLHDPAAAARKALQTTGASRF